jgi:hypothetical protein
MICDLPKLAWTFDRELVKLIFKAYDARGIVREIGGRPGSFILSGRNRVDILLS